jgi:hypothetical protein
MLRPFAFLASVMLTGAALADTFTGIVLNPRALDSHTALTAVVSGTTTSLCGQRGTASVSGQTVTLTIATASGGLPCVGIPIAVSWSAPVFIGTLPPGNYDLVTKFGTTEVDRRRIAVTDAGAPFELRENVGLTTGGGAVTISANETFAAFNTTAVTFDDQPATILSKSVDKVVVSPPPHAAGAVTVKATANGTTLTAVNAFRYVDANGPADRAAYEPILIPLVFSGAGLFGSQWTTELWVHNLSDADITQFNGPFTVRFCVVAPCPQPIEANRAVKLDSVQFPNGRMMFVPRGSADALHFALRVRDLSRQSETHGVEIPVVRERDLRVFPFSLLNVPGDALFRSRLRVYSIDPPKVVGVRLFTMTNPAQQVAALLLFMDPPTADFPAYGEIDLDPIIRKAGLPGPFRVQIEPSFLTVSPAYWAFVSVTNNQTQNVTVVTPQ